MAKSKVKLPRVSIGDLIVPLCTVSSGTSHILNIKYNGRACDWLHILGHLKVIYCMHICLYVRSTTNIHGSVLL